MYRIGYKQRRKKMPAFKDKLSAEQVAAAVKFVREESQKNEEMPRSISIDMKGVIYKHFIRRSLRY